MKTVKASQHEKSGAKYARRQLQIQLAIGVHIFLNLEAQKREAEHHSQEQSGNQLAAFISLECMVRPGNSNPRRQQQHGIEQWNPPWPHRRELLRRILLEIWPYCRPSCIIALPDKRIIQVRKPWHRKHTCIKKGPEKGSKKHDFRKDEPTHAPAERGIHLLVKQAGFAFTDHLAKPAEQHVQQNRKTDCKRD